MEDDHSRAELWWASDEVLANNYFTDVLYRTTPRLLVTLTRRDT